MSSAEETHYVLIIHGTWSAPKPGGPPLWFQTDDADPDNFCTRLNGLLRDGPHGAAVWRPLPNGDSTFFSWDGDNTDEARRKAASQLFGLIRGISQADRRARIHLVGHSHGGNVLLKAVDLYREHLKNVVDPAFYSYEGLNESDPLVMEKAISRAVAGSELNRLGRVVCLGTPFYKAAYHYGQFSLRRATFWAYEWSFVAVQVFLGLYIKVISLWFMGYLCWLFAPPRWNPLAWPLWMLVFYVAAGLMFLRFAAYAFRGVVPRDGNYYFDDEPRSIWKTTPIDGEDNRVEALTITSSWIDEALVGLSSEAIVTACIDPQLRSLLQYRSIKLMPEFRFVAGCGISTASLILRLILRFLGWAINVLARTITQPFRLLALPVLRGALVKAVTGSALGVWARELAGFEIRAVPRIGVDNVFKESHWDVTRELLSAPPQRSAPGRVDSPQVRYAYLWDDNELGVRQPQSFLWKKIQDSILSGGPLSKQLGSDSHRHLARVCITIEERLKEIAGAVELNHSLYYSNDLIIRAIANFLERGTLPETVSPESASTAV